MFDRFQINALFKFMSALFTRLSSLRHYRTTNLISISFNNFDAQFAHKKCVYFLRLVKLSNGPRSDNTLLESKMPMEAILLKFDKKDCKKLIQICH